MSTSSGTDDLPAAGNAFRRISIESWQNLLQVVSGLEMGSLSVTILAGLSLYGGAAFLLPVVAHAYTRVQVGRAGFVVLALLLFALSILQPLLAQVVSVYR